MTEQKIDLAVQIGRLTLRNPVMTSSGTFGYGEDFADLIDLETLGAIVVKGTSLHPRMGNPPNRFIEVTGCAMLTCVGLQNVGLQRFIDEKLPYLRTVNTPVVVNVACESVDDYRTMSEVLDSTDGVDAIEVNLACPNVRDGGAMFAADPKMVYEIVSAVRKATKLTVIAKAVPSTVDAATLAKVCAEAGADAFSPNFGPKGIAIDVKTRRSKLGRNLAGALGGPALKPVALRMAWEAANAVKIPIIGGGGVACAEDALEYLIAGATAVEIGAYSLINPRVFGEIVEGITEHLESNGLTSVRDLIGTFVAP